MKPWDLKNDSGSIAFNEKTYELLRQVPAGKVVTYADIARALGTKAYRAVGNAMNKNPYAPHVPCHRVVNSDGRIGGFALGCEKKTALLEKEGVDVKSGKIVDFEKKRFQFGAH
ncbi:MGMT family protein [Candidatus Woesearchaeota archaeon]|nr:MGMT family protein [Candidatus Woesearchaeota archaeon]